jgi:hypothetical protein
MSNVAYGDQYQDAIKAAGDAFYKYEHLDDDMSRYLSKYEAMFTDNQKKVGGWTYFIAKVMIDRQVTYTWHF